MKKLTFTLFAIFYLQFSSIAQDKIDTLIFTLGDHEYQFDNSKDKYSNYIIAEPSYSYICDLSPTYKGKWTIPIYGKNTLRPETIYFSEYFDPAVLIKLEDIDSLVYGTTLDIVPANYNDTISLKDQLGHERKLLGFKFTLIDRYGYITQGYQQYNDDRTTYELFKIKSDISYIVIEKLYYIEEGLPRARCILPFLVLEMASK